MAVCTHIYVSWLNKRCIASPCRPCFTGLHREDCSNTLRKEKSKMSVVDLSLTHKKIMRNSTGKFWLG